VSPIGAAVIETIRIALSDLDALPPDERSRVVEMLLADLRTRGAQPLGTLPAPTERIRDPRGGQQ
jgi:hypothetical protein